MTQFRITADPGSGDNRSQVFKRGNQPTCDHEALLRWRIAITGIRILVVIIGVPPTTTTLRGRSTNECEHKLKRPPGLNVRCEKYRWYPALMPLYDSIHRRTHQAPSSSRPSK
jgi:hypothetical protein